MSNDGSDFNPRTDFRFVMGEKPELVVVLFYGKIAAREIEFLQDIEKQLKEKTQPIILLNLRDVAVLLPAAHQFLAKFQKGIRDNGKLLGICGLHPDIKTSLLLAGIVREVEIFNNIPDAWKTLSSKHQNNQSKKQGVVEAAKETKEAA